MNRIISYYHVNPEKKPKCIYIGWVYIPTGVSTGHVIDKARAERTADMIIQRFDCEREDLSNGILLTVNQENL